MRSRVVPGISSTIATRSPSIRLKKVDLPTLGRPTIATSGFILRPSTLVMIKKGIHTDGMPLVVRYYNTNINRVVEVYSYRRRGAVMTFHEITRKHFVVCSLAIYGVRDSQGRWHADRSEFA